MKDGFDWRWLLRRSCRAIAETRAIEGEFRITLCRRHRWHRGSCMGGQS